MIGYWNDDEDAALQGLSLEAQIIYLRGIRRFADKNGVAGIERRINRASLSEVCHFLPVRRSPRPESKPTWEQVRHRLNELENAGLIVQKPNLVFELPLSVQMKTACRRPVDDTPMTPPKTTRTESFSGNGFDGGDDTLDGTKTTPTNMDVDATTPPVTNINTCSSSIGAAENSIFVSPGQMRFVIPLNWQPSYMFQAYAVIKNVDHTKLTPEILADFVTFNNAKNERKTQAEWDDSLVNLLRWRINSPKKQPTAAPTQSKRLPTPDNFASKDYGTGGAL